MTSTQPPSFHLISRSTLISLAAALISYNPRTIDHVCPPFLWLNRNYNQHHHHPHLMHLLLLFVGCTMWPYVGDCVLPAALNGPIEYCIPFRPFPRAFLFFKYKSSIHTPTTHTNHHNPNGHPHPILYYFTENHRFFDGFCDRGPSPQFAPISRGPCSCVC